MAKKQSNDGGFLPFDLDSLEPDPAVSALVSKGQAAQAERKLPVKERQKKARQKAKDAKRSKVLYDIPESIIQEVADVAKWHQTTASGVAALALRRLLDDIASGGLRLRDYLEPMDHPRYEFRVRINKDDRDIPDHW